VVILCLDNDFDDFGGSGNIYGWFSRTTLLLYRWKTEKNRTKLTQNPLEHPKSHQKPSLFHHQHLQIEIFIVHFLKGSFKNSLLKKNFKKYLYNF
jgi:hypothetical protein